MPSHYKEKGLKLLKKTNPQLHNSLQETIQQIEQEKIDKQVAKIKKLLKK